MANRLSFRSSIGAGLIAFFSLSHLNAQTLPTVTAVNDVASFPAGQVGATTVVKTNDVVPTGSVFSLGTGSTCVAPVSVSAAGMATYTVPASGTCKVNYKVCAPAPNATVCSTATLTVTALDSDDDSSVVAIVVALKPICTITASPTSVVVNGAVTLSAVCSKAPTSYKWYRGTTLLGTTTTPTYATTAPTTVGPITFGVVANPSKVPSNQATTNVTVLAAIPPVLALSTSATATTGAPVPISGSLSGGTGTFTTSIVVGNQTLAVTQLANGNFSASWTPSQSGVYKITVNAIDSAGKVVTTTSSRTVVADTPSVTTMTLPGTSSAGAMAGSFGVSDMGGAQYSIPISVPPGVAGMQPGISLSYSSTGGNGHVGVGWNIGGLSAITRCPKTIAIDGFRAGINYDKDPANDAYCLDGQRLIQISEKLIEAPDPDVTDMPPLVTVKLREYRTEIDRFDRIESVETTASDRLLDGARNFRVFTKSGQIMDYGWRWWNLNRGQAQLSVDAARGNVVRTWPLDRVYDRNGNFYTVDYAGTSTINSVPVRAASNGTVAADAPPIKPVGAFPQVEFYPTQITYTRKVGADTLSTKVNRVVFVYEDRPANDRHIYFDPGAGQHLLSKRLSAIATYIDGNVIDFPLAYPNPNYPLDRPYPVCAGSDCGTKVKEYRLTYDPAPATNRSRLNSIQECTGDGSVCLSPTTFAWSGITKNMKGLGSGIVGLGGTDLANFNEFNAADINGDGRTDLYRRYGSNPGHIQALISQPDGTFVERRIYASAGEVAGPADTSVYALDANGDGRADFFVLNNNTSYMRICITNPTATQVDCSALPGGVAAPAKGVFYQGDFDGDGKIDLLLFRGLKYVTPGDITTAFHEWDLVLGSSTGFSSAVRKVHTPYLGQSVGEVSYAFSPFSMQVGDFNGDGRVDLLARKIPERCVTQQSLSNVNYCYDVDGVTISTVVESWQMFLSTPGLTQPPVAGQPNFFAWTAREVNLERTEDGDPRYRSTYDFNGDGLADVMTEYQTFCLSGGDGSFGSFESLIVNPNPNPGLPAARVGTTAGSLCKGTRTESAQALPAIWQSVNFDEIIFGDFDGDGRTDMLAKKPNFTASVCLSRTSASGDPAALGNNVFFDCSDWLLQTNEAFSNIKVGDFNGDGKTDLLSSNGGNGIVLSYAGDATGTSSARMLPDHIVRITNGLGAYTDINYAPITEPGVYIKGVGQTGVKLDIQSPMYVVKSTASSDGLAAPGTFNTTYAYESLIGQTDGRGLLGFGKRTVTHNNGAATVRTEMTYEQEWWKAGRIKTVKKYVDNVLVNEATNTYDWRQNTPYTKVNQVFLINTIEKSWNLSLTNVAEALPYTITETPMANIDAYGNVAKVIATTYEPNGTANGYAKETTNAFNTENATAWILGRLSTASVTHRAPGPRSTTRSSSFDYHPTTGQLTVERVEPNGVTDERVTTTYGYDAYGHRTSTQVSFFENGLPKSRSSTINYDNATDPRFPISATNTLSQSVTYNTYDKRWGAVTESTDLNGLKSIHYLDGFGRKIGESVKDAQGLLLGMSTMTYGPLANGYTVSTKTHTGGQSQTQYDSLGREISASALNFAGNMVTSTTAYDTYGRKVWSSGPRGGAGGISAYLTMTYSYDKLGRPIGGTTRTGNGTPTGAALATSNTAYSIADIGGQRVTSVTAQQTGAQYGTQQVIKYTDSQGRTVRITDNAAQTTDYAYDPLGNLEKVTGPGNIVETMTYDLRGRKKTATNANIAPGQYSYVYNGAGELISQTDPKSQTTTITYDNLGRMTNRVEASPSSLTFTSTWTYDNSTTGVSAGKLLKSEMNNIKHEFKYDAQSRLTQTDATIGGKLHNRYSLYNALGQLSYIGYPDSANNIAPFGVRHRYNAYGYPITVTRHDNDSETYWQAGSRYDDGSLATGTQGGAAYDKDHDPLGRLSTVRLKNSAGTLVQTSSYSYDNIGNVLTRAQAYVGNIAGGANYSEAYCYDSLNRVTHAVPGVATTTCSAATAQFAYSGDGNLTSKGAAAGSTGNIGAITYGSTARPNGAGPHAVSTANGKTYVYDANGNFTNFSDATRRITYTPFNLPISIVGTNPNITGVASVNVLSYEYDADHQRVIEQTDTGATTFYVGAGFFESVTNADSTREYRHYIAGPEGTIGIRTVRADDTNTAANNGANSTTRYWYKDHLGSPASEYDAGGSNLTALGFDTWGLRRKSTAANSFTQSLSTADLASYQSPRGYTGHEHLDEVGLIHMNGRIYDPMIGRFLQPDPIISEPYNSQNFNRYAYVLNNPLMYTDPSGYSTWTQVRGPVVAIVVAIVTYNAGLAYLSQGTQFVWSVETYAGFQATAAVASGFASGGVAGGNIESAIAGAFQAAAFSGIGIELGHTDPGFFQGNHGVRIVAHAAVGCAAAGVQGGSCGQGAASAGFAAFAGPIVDAVPTYEGQVVAHAVAGGLGSMAAGGKFANGAITGAFGYIYNSAGGAGSNISQDMVPSRAQALANILIEGNVDGWRPISTELVNYYETDANGAKANLMAEGKADSPLKSKVMTYATKDGGTLKVQEHHLGHNNAGQKPEAPHFNATKYDANGKNLGALQTASGNTHFQFQATHSYMRSPIRLSTTGALRPTVSNLTIAVVRASGWQY
jgi:RHS repeat-associated protein